MRAKRMWVVLMLCFSVTNAIAGNKWYRGSITYLQTLGPDGSFIVYLDNEEIKSNCAYKRIKFLVEDMGYERTKLAFSMALTALTANKTYGVVVDISGLGEVCHASGTASQGADIAP